MAIFRLRALVFMYGCWVSWGIGFRPCWSIMLVGRARAAGSYGLRGLYSRAILCSSWPSISLGSPGRIPGTLCDGL